MTKAEKASELFANNFNCSQAVLTAFAPDFGLDEKLEAHQKALEEEEKRKAEEAARLEEEARLKAEEAK